MGADGGESFPRVVAGVGGTMAREMRHLRGVRRLYYIATHRICLQSYNAAGQQRAVGYTPGFRREEG